MKDKMTSELMSFCLFLLSAWGAFYVHHNSNK